MRMRLSAVSVYTVQIADAETDGQDTIIAAG